MTDRNSPPTLKQLYNQLVAAHVMVEASKPTGDELTQVMAQIQAILDQIDDLSDSMVPEWGAMTQTKMIVKTAQWVIENDEVSGTFDYESVNDVILLDGPQVLAHVTGDLWQIESGPKHLRPETLMIVTVDLSETPNPISG